MLIREYVVLDVFTDVPLQGNQLAVFTDGSALRGQVMQRAAREMSLSETVFVLAPGERADGAGVPGARGAARLPGAGADARIRIFTPAIELPFAGHPVLGAAFVVGESTGSSVVRLQTGVGVIPVELTREDGRIVAGEMEQPIPEPEPFANGDRLLAALGLERSGLPIEAYRNGPLHIYVELPSAAAVAALRPDLGALTGLGTLGVNCFAGACSAFKTRMFAPALGVDEDPATGSAAGPLALHLARHGRIAFGQEMELRQGAEIGRPSLLRARVDGSPGHIERIVVGGSAVLVARGEYRLA